MVDGEQGRVLIIGVVSGPQLPNDCWEPELLFLEAGDRTLRRLHGEEARSRSCLLRIVSSRFGCVCLGKQCWCEQVKGAFDDTGETESGLHYDFAFAPSTLTRLIFQDSQ